jgi:2-deoxy-D-gluconate 3-dehydrogenase
MVATAVEELGTVDIAFANAALNNEFAPLIESTMEQWQLDVDVNLTGVYLTAREVAKVMVPRRRGKIITTSSIMGYRASSRPGRGQWYSAAKAAVINLTRALGVELAEHNVQVNGIAPTYTRTGMFRQASGADYERVTSRMPIGRLAEPHEYKGVAVFLASPASDLMTGFTIAVDGGYLAW